MILKPPIPMLEFLCNARIELAQPLNLGLTPLAERRIIPIVGGRFEGQLLKGEILPGGADWQMIRSDKGALLDARYTLRTWDGAYIYIQNKGLRCGPVEVLARLASGEEEVDPASYYFRTTPSFETGAPQYHWLNDLIVVASGIRLANTVILDFYLVR